MGRMILLICAVVVAVGLGASQPAPEPQRGSSSSPAVEKGGPRKAGQPSGPATPAPLPVVIVETPAQAESREKGETESTEHERLDLKAQEKAADAAEAQVTPNRIGAFLTVVGTVAIFWTLLLTQQSLNLSRRTSAAELRAYLGVHSYEALHMPDGGVDLSLRVQNFGQTPAVRLRCVWAIVTGPPGPIADAYDFPVGQTKHQDVGLLTPNGEFNFGPHRLRAEQVVALVEGQISCHIYGSIDYNDTLPQTPRRRVEFCTRLEAAKTEEKTIIRFAATDRHNNMDDDCEHQPEPW